jgi:serine protease Do
LIVLGSFAARAEEPDLGESLEARVKDLFTFNRSAVVKIQSSDQHGRIEGTGFFADSSGTIYTVLEVVGDGRNITVCQGVRQMPASLLIADPRTGIALIKVAGATSTPFIPIGDSSKLEVSSPLVAIGYPTDRPVSPSLGLVAGFDKEYLNKFFRTTHIRANLPVQPGLGGAPVLNLSGEAVGIVVSGVDGNAACYVLPINAAEKTRADFANFGKLRPGYVGISVEPAPEGTQPSTARIANLQPESPAAQAGIREGDLLIRVGDVPIHNPVDIFDASFFLTAGAETPITISRDGKEQLVNVRVAESPYAGNPSVTATPGTTSLTLTLETSQP